MIEGEGSTREIDDDFGDEFGDDEDLYISKVKPSGYDYETQKTVKDSEIWTAKAEARKEFAKEGFSFDAVNFDYKLSGKLQIHANVGAENFFRRLDVSKQDITQKIKRWQRK